MHNVTAIALRLALIGNAVTAGGCSLWGHGPRDITKQVRQDATRGGMLAERVGFVPGHVYRLTRDARLRADDVTLNWVDADPTRRPMLNPGDLDVAAGTHFRIDRVMATDTGVNVDYECRGMILDGTHAGRRFSNALLADGTYASARSAGGTQTTAK